MYVYYLDSYHPNTDGTTGKEAQGAARGKPSRTLDRRTDHRYEGRRGQPTAGQLLATHGNMRILWNGGLPAPASPLHCAGQKMSRMRLRGSPSTRVQNETELARSGDGIRRNSKRKTFPSQSQYP
jgi:hypothetical protein